MMVVVSDLLIFLPVGIPVVANCLEFMQAEFQPFDMPCRVSIDAQTAPGLPATAPGLPTTSKTAAERHRIAVPGGTSLRSRRFEAIRKGIVLQCLGARRRGGGGEAVDPWT